MTSSTPSDAICNLHSLTKSQIRFTVFRRQINQNCAMTTIQLDYVYNILYVYNVYNVYNYVYVCVN